jgi:hypothetical protein
MQEKLNYLQVTGDRICVCGALESDWNEHHAPHGNHAFVPAEDNLNRPLHQQE